MRCGRGLFIHWKYPQTTFRREDYCHVNVGRTHRVVFVGQQLRVVLIEDEIQVRGYIQNLLESLDCAVNSLRSIDLAETCRAAVAADLLLIDSTLPGVDLESMLVKLRQQFPLLSLVLLIPASNRSGFLAAAREGIYDVLPKPFLKHQLNAILRRVQD